MKKPEVFTSVNFYKFKMKKGAFILLVGLIGIILAEIGSSAYTIANYSISGAPGEMLRGGVRMSFQNENADSMFSLGNQEMSLRDFLDYDSASYTCSPSDCSSVYSAGNPSANKTFSLSYGEKKLLAFSLNGSFSSIQNSSFLVQGIFPPSCLSPLEIDIGDDNEAELFSGEFIDDYQCKYDNGMGCFNPSGTLGETAMNGIYCEKMKLIPGKRYQLGAWVKKGTGTWSDGLLKMSLYSSQGYKLKTCNLPEPGSVGGEISCIINLDKYTGKIKDYYVCINSTNSAGYKIKHETENPCGNSRAPIFNNFTADYWIFARGARFAGLTGRTFNDAEFRNQGNINNLSSFIYNYIENEYENCTNGCIVPISVKSYANTNISLSNVYIKTSAGISNKVYDASKSSGTVSSGIQTLDLESLNFIIPYNADSIELYFRGEKLAGRNFSSGTLRINWITPSRIPAGASVQFYVSVNSSSPIFSYFWDFGDGESEETDVPRINHAYSSVGSYSLEISVENEDGMTAERVFQVTAENPATSISQIINSYRNYLNNISSWSSGRWYEDILEREIKLNWKRAMIDSIEARHNASENSTELMSNLTSLNVPSRIWESEKGNVPFVFSEYMIDADALEELGAGEHEEGIGEKILAEFARSYSGKLNYSVISVYGNYGKEDILTAYSLKINGNRKDSYLIIDADREDVSFKEDYGSRDAGDNYGIVIPELSSAEFYFTMKGRKDIPQEIAYISPSFSELQAEERPFTPIFLRAMSNWKLFFYILLVLILGFSGYLYINWHYKRRYYAEIARKNERLIKRLNLFNLVNFINLCIEKNIDYTEMFNALKEKGWSEMYIEYAYRNRTYLEGLGNFIREALWRGINPDVIWAKLKERGWLKEEIEYAYKKSIEKQ